MSEKPTPLTDEEAMKTHGTPLAHYVRADFARDLERQLAEARGMESNRQPASSSRNPYNILTIKHDAL
jgi:hypothetical protein